MPKDISVPLKGSPTDLKEEGYVAVGKGDVSLRGNGRRSREPRGRAKEEKEGAGRGFTLTIHPLSGRNAKKC